MRWRTNFLSVMTVAGMMVLTTDAAPLWNNLQYLACKPGELSLALDGYFSSLEIFLAWFSQWAIISVLYKINTGKWPPSPFQNDKVKEEILIPSTPHRTPEPIVEMPPSTSRTDKNSNSRQPKPPGFIYDTPKSVPFGNIRRT